MSGENKEDSLSCFDLVKKNCQLSLSGDKLAEILSELLLGTKLPSSMVPRVEKAISEWKDANKNI